MSAASHRELAFLSAAHAAALVKSKEVSPVELAEACLGRIEALNPSLNAFISVTAAAALDQAKVPEAEVRRGEWEVRDVQMQTPETQVPASPHDS